MDAENMFETNQDDTSSEGDQQQMVVAAAPIGEQKPDIFKLDVDCFGEVFDWLSLKDLHAFGQTCKRMQQVAGYYFRQTYPRAEVDCSEEGIECNNERINDFSDFIESISFNEYVMNHEYVRNHEYDWNQFRFAQSNEFKSLKKMSLHGISFTDEKIACIKKNLSKVEDIEINNCGIIDNFYQQFLQYFPNIRRLDVQFLSENVTVRYNWLLEHYQGLEQLVLCSKKDVRRIYELTTFFNRNSNLQHFATSVQILLLNRQSIMTSTIKLDTLGILFKGRWRKDDIRKLLNEFYEREIFKRLHLYVGMKAEDVVNQIDQTNCVEKIAYLMLPMDVSSLRFINLKDLYSELVPIGLDMDAVARTLVNLEVLCFGYSTSIQNFAFIRHSRKLKHIGIERIREEGKKNFDLVLLNKERAKLNGARKVAVYVDEELYLAIKKATQNQEFSLIEIKRIDSHRLFNDFCMINV